MTWVTCATTFGPMLRFDRGLDAMARSWRYMTPVDRAASCGGVPGLVLFPMLVAWRRAKWWLGTKARLRAQLADLWRAFHGLELRHRRAKAHIKVLRQDLAKHLRISRPPVYVSAAAASPYMPARFAETLKVEAGVRRGTVVIRPDRDAPASALEEFIAGTAEAIGQDVTIGTAAELAKVLLPGHTIVIHRDTDPKTEMRPEVEGRMLGWRPLQVSILRPDGAVGSTRPVGGGPARHLYEDEWRRSPPVWGQVAP